MEVVRVNKYKKYQNQVHTYCWQQLIAMFTVNAITLDKNFIGISIRYCAGMQSIYTSSFQLLLRITTAYSQEVFTLKLVDLKAINKFDSADIASQLFNETIDMAEEEGITKNFKDFSQFLA